MPGRNLGRKRKPRRRKADSRVVSVRVVQPSRRKRTMVSSAPVPAQKKVQLRYVEQICIDAPAAGVAALFLFRANDMFDPDFTGGGHQPKGFDQWMIFYDHFTVIGSKIKVTYATTTTTAATGNVLCGLYLNNDTVLSTVSEFLLEEKLNKYTVIGPIDGGKAITTLRHSFSASKFFGKKNIVGSAEYKGTTAASPTEDAYYQVWVAALALADNPGPVDIVVEIEYLAVLTERKTLAQS